jgi:predicted HTH transcriptional regulator
MTSSDELKFLRSLIGELLKLPKETPWVEFKHNNANPTEIGEYLSALSNAAALEGKSNAYVVWGVEDDSHNIVGTNFKPTQAKKSNEDLENWLVRKLSPRLHFRFHSFSFDEFPVVVLEIPRSHSKPTQFDGIEYVRVGSYRQKLRDCPERERALWRILDETPFESRIAREHVEAAYSGAS